jgi:hypothetical protein
LLVDLYRAESPHFKKIVKKSSDMIKRQKLQLLFSTSKASVFGHQVAWRLISAPAMNFFNVKKAAEKILSFLF